MPGWRGWRTGLTVSLESASKAGEKTMSLIGLLITVAVFALICYVIFWLVVYLGVPEPVRKVIVVVVVLIAVIWILTNFLPGTTAWHWSR